MGIPLIPRTFFGSHRTDDELLTALYLENLYLRERNEEQTSDIALKPAGIDNVADQPEYFEVRKFLSRDGRARVAPRHLVIANDYPDYGKEYGNGFVHRRVRAYQEAGLSVDVVLFNKRAPRRVYEYDGVTVLSGGAHELNGLLTSQTYKSISAHFFNREMWSTLYHHRRSRPTPLHIFVHGYDARHWLRRRNDIHTYGELRIAIERSNALRRFWTELSTSPLRPDSFVFVSKYWSEVMQEDMDVSIDADRIRIIHNFIDGELFQYHPKPAEQRFRILWARSASARHYGADIGVKVLRQLLTSRHGERIEATIVGDGQYFNEFDEAFASDPRVSIRRGFITQNAIAELHQTHGLFLVPSRLDTQGVSRDEAMSSGLVPLTNGVAAIPEFVDNTCGVVAPAEDATAMAKGALQLMDGPQMFLSRSEAASLRARRQSGRTFTIDQEIAIMEGTSQ